MAVVVRLPLVDTTALVDQVTGGGRLARVDVADDDDVDVRLVVLAHLDGIVWLTC